MLSDSIRTRLRVISEAIRTQITCFPVGRSFPIRLALPSPYFFEHAL